jgi:hypothetical protein
MKEDNVESDNLLPCPFCGSKARRKIINEILQVGCEQCLIMFANHVRLGCLADAKWNTRVNK